MTPAQYERLKRAEQQALRDAERAAGAREQLLAELKARHACDGVEQGEKLKRKLQKESAALDAECDRQMAGLERDYGDKLGDV